MWPSEPQEMWGGGEKEMLECQWGVRGSSVEEYVLGMGVGW